MLKTTIAAIAIFAATATALGQDIRVDWEVKHRFRFFDVTAEGQPSIFYRMQEEAWASITNNRRDTATIGDLERKLNDQDWLQAYFRRNTNELGLDANDLEFGSHARYGWAAPIVTNSATCWNRRQQTHAECPIDKVGPGGRTYVRPERHTVLARVLDEDGAIVDGLECTWTAPTTSVFVGEPRDVKSIAVPCSETVELRIPFNLDEDDLSLPTVMTVSTSEGVKKSVPIAVRDFLVVGLGDSYSSGEGNPDKPVVMAAKPRTTHGGSRSSLPPYFLDDDGSLVHVNKAKNLPLRPPEGKTWPHLLPERAPGVAPALWHDRSCHRSLYSYHFRIGMQMALEGSKQSAVTLLTYACSGSRITKGILLDHAGVERAKVETRKDLPQLARMIEDLCRESAFGGFGSREEEPLRDPNNVLLTVPVFEIKHLPKEIDFEDKSIPMPVCGERTPKDHLRAVDLVLLSVGGNDAGFVQLAAYALVNGDNADELRERNRRKFNPLPSLIERFYAHDLSIGQEKLARLPEKYAVLSKALRATGIPFRNAQGKLTHESGGKPNVVITAFPRIENNENGEVCGTSGSMAKRLREARRVATIARNYIKIDAGRLREVSQFSDKLYDTIKAAAGVEGFMFVDSPREEFARHGICAQSPNARAASASPEERMQIPIYRFQTGTGPSGGWVLGSRRGQNWGCYVNVQRSIRSFDDAYMCANTVYAGTTGGERDPFEMVTQALGGPVHPNAVGHSRIADAVWADLKSSGLLGRLQ